MAIMNCIVRRSFLIVSLGLLLAQSTAQKTPELRMNTGVPPGTVTAQGLSVCADGDTVYVTWSDDRGGFGVKGVFLNRSLDAGSTWLPGDVQVNRSSATTWAERPAVAAEGSTVYVAWVDARNGLGRPSIYFNRSLDNGITWLPNDVRLDTERQSGTAFTPAIACHGDAVYVTWSDRRQGLVYDDIYFNRSLDRGSTWLPVAVRINTGNSFSQSEQLEPRIAVTAQTLCVIWQDYRNHDPAIYANRSLDRGTSWLSSEMQLDLPNSTSSNARIAASGLNVYVAWQAGVNLNDIYCNRSLDGGTSWLNTPRRLDLGSAPGAASSVTPDIAADGLLVYATWVDKRNGAPGDVYLNRSFDGGMTWLAEEKRVNTGVAPGSGLVTLPRIAASGPNVFVAWGDGRSGASDVYFNRSSDFGGSFLVPDVRLDNGDPPGASSSGAPGIALSTESVYVVWLDTRNGMTSQPFDVYFNIAFGFQPYGNAKAGSGGILPKISGRGFPTTGGASCLVVAQAVGGGAASLWVGVGPASKAALPILGGTVLVTPVLAFPLALGGAAGTPGAGGAVVPLELPMIRELVGGTLNWQAFVLDPGATFGIGMTNALEMWIG